MIWLLGAALAAEPVEPANASLGVGLDLAALRGSSRHDVAAGLRLWGTMSPRPWSATVEIAVVPHADRTDLYAYHSFDVDSSVLAEAVLAPHATAFRAGLGPALILRTTTFESGDRQAVDLGLEGGLRARVALDGPLGKRLAWTWHMGSTAHPSGVDWDTGVGFGVAL